MSRRKYVRCLLLAVATALAASGAVFPLRAAVNSGQPGAKPITLRGDLGSLNCLAFSPDGKAVASGGEGTSVELWDVTAAKHQVLKDHSGKIDCLAFSLDGKTLAVGSYKQVRLWDVATGRDLATLKGHTGALQCMLFLPDGKTLITASRLEAKRWQLNSDQDPITFESREPGQWVLSPDGKRLGKSNRNWNDFVLWDGDTGKEPKLIRSSWTNCIAFSSDSRTVATGMSEQVRLWDAATGEQLSSHGLHTGDVVSVAVAPDGKTVVSGSRDKTAILWDVTTKKERATLKGHKGDVVARYFPDGKMVITYSQRDESVRLWDVATGKERAVIQETGGVRFAVVSPDGKTLATTGPDGVVRLWDVDALPPSAK
jgi:WD40 repeat protein